MLVAVQLVGVAATPLNVPGHDAVQFDKYPTSAGGRVAKIK